MVNGALSASPLSSCGEASSGVVRASAANDASHVIRQSFTANRGGNGPSPIHGPSHLHDARVSGGAYNGQAIDLTGGWMDAGDMIHFTETTAYSAIMLQVAATLDPADAAALRDEAEVGVRWLIKAHPFADLFIGQVGDARDHDQGFRDPALDDASTLPGIGHRLAYPSTGSQLSGKTAAALALAAEQETGDVRDLLVAAAQQWYESGQATAGPGPLLPGGFYRDTTWKDDLAFGAVMLWRVTGDVTYRDEAAAYLTGLAADELAWSNTAPLAGADLCGALGHPAAGNPPIRTLGCNVLAASAQGALDAFTVNSPWGTPGWFGWGHSGSNGAQGAISELATRGGVASLHHVATRARDWMLGENPWGVSFVVGYGTPNPQHPHHWASTFGTRLPVGAVVGGAAPKKQNKAEGFVVNGPFDTGRAAYQDVLANYVVNEPAIDYTANSILLLAALAAP